MSRDKMFKNVLMKELKKNKVLFFSELQIIKKDLGFTTKETNEIIKPMLENGTIVKKRKKDKVCYILNNTEDTTTKTESKKEKLKTYSYEEVAELKRNKTSECLLGFKLFISHEDINSLEKISEELFEFFRTTSDEKRDLFETVQHTLRFRINPTTTIPFRFAGLSYGALQYLQNLVSLCPYFVRMLALNTEISNEYLESRLIPSSTMVKGDLTNSVRTKIIKDFIKLLKLMDILKEEQVIYDHIRYMRYSLDLKFILNERWTRIMEN